MNPRLARLHPYPFQKLAQLTADCTPPKDKSPITLAVGEPKHDAPAFVLEAMRAHLDGLSRYPLTRGTRDLREACGAWATRRFGLRAALDPERHVLPACGTREALFSVVQALVGRLGHALPVVVTPNPFYQIYEGAALLAGAEIYYVNTSAADGYRMDLAGIPEAVLERTQLVFLCSPGNPTGRVLSHEELAQAIALSQRYGFILAADECYSEIYFDEAAPPVSLLQVADALGLDDYKNCLVFHSLSKRSNLPGLRSGFVAGDPRLIADFLRYRTYHGSAMSEAAQAASSAAWRDEAHVRANRELYRRQFDAVLEILAPVLAIERPQAGFYLWPAVPGGDDEAFARELYRRENVLVLPGRYLSRPAHGGDPGNGRARMALVASFDECVEAARRVRRFIEGAHAGTRAAAGAGGSRN